MLSNNELFHPVSTGAPRYDLCTHLTNLPPLARLDFEAHTLAGNLILRFEPGLGKESDTEANSKIVSLPYAYRVLGRHADAVEFIRCVRLIAGEDAQAFNLQTIAAHYYQQARQRDRADVLAEMALLARELVAVTAPLADESEVDPAPAPNEALAPLTSAQKYALWQQRTAEVLGESETVTSYFEAELQAQRHCRSHAAPLVYDEFAADLREQEAACADLDEVDALYSWYEAVHEQYDEGHLVSLHLHDGERMIVVGTLEDDITEDCLPPHARPLAAQMYALYTNGFPLTEAHAPDTTTGQTLTAYRRQPRTGARETQPVIAFGLDTWRDYALDELYHERVTRIARQVLVVPVTASETALPETARARHATRLYEQTYWVEVCPDATEREQTRTVLETLLARWQSDCHTRGLHTSPVYRTLTQQLAEARDTAVIARLKREAWQLKEQGRLALKLFTVWLTHAKLREAYLVSTPLTETHQVNGEPRNFRVAQPLMHLIPTLTGGTIEAFNRALHALPQQEQNRVREAVQRENPHFYARVRDGLAAELRQSSAARLRYFRWACYGANKPEHPFHLLTTADQAAAWELLKELSARPGRTVRTRSTVTVSPVPPVPPVSPAPVVQVRRGKF